MLSFEEFSRVADAAIDGDRKMPPPRQPARLKRGPNPAAAAKLRETQAAAASTDEVSSVALSCATAMGRWGAGVSLLPSSTDTVGHWVSLLPSSIDTVGHWVFLATLIH